VPIRAIRVSLRRGLQFVRGDFAVAVLVVLGEEFPAAGGVPGVAGVLLRGVEFAVFVGVEAFEVELLPAGDEFLVRLGSAGAVDSDSPFGGSTLDLMNSTTPAHFFSLP